MEYRSTAFPKEDLQDPAEENRVYFSAVSVIAGVYDLGQCMYAALYRAYGTG